MYRYLFSNIVDTAQQKWLNRFDFCFLNVKVTYSKLCCASSKLNRNQCSSFRENQVQNFAISPIRIVGWQRVCNFIDTTQQKRLNRFDRYIQKNKDTNFRLGNV